MKLSLVVPVYNEEDAIPIFIQHIHRIFDSHKDLFIEFIFVNDGSTDATLSVLLGYHNITLKLIDLSRNFGKEAALTAGLFSATGEVIVPLDVDLQDPPELIIPMIEKWREGYEVVLGRRVNRDSDSFLKRISAYCFYKVHNLLSNPKLPENVGDFRLMDRKVVEALKKLPESQRFMKGIFAWLGFRTAYIDYKRPERVAGKTKFNGWRLWLFALEGITSFSTKPLQILTYLGAFISTLSFGFGLYILFRVLIYGSDTPGYASLMVVMTFLSGIQITGIGILGEYLGRTYMESKGRPIYIVREIYEKERQDGP